MFIDEEEDFDGSDAEEEVEEVEEPQDEPEESNDEPEESDETDWKAEALKQKAINSRLSKKLDQPEKPKPKEQPAPQPNEQSDGISPMDAIALVKADVTLKEDIDEVLEYSKLKKISITEALASNVIKTILKEKEEERKSAEATNTGTARRGSSKPTPEQVLANAEAGKLPDDPELLAEARLLARKKK